MGVINLLWGLRKRRRETLTRVKKFSKTYVLPAILFLLTPSDLLSVDFPERTSPPMMASLTHQPWPQKLLLSGLMETLISGSHHQLNSRLVTPWPSLESEAEKIVPTLSHSSRVDEHLTIRQNCLRQIEKLFALITYIYYLI